MVEDFSTQFSSVYKKFLTEVGVDSIVGDPV